MSKRHRRRIWKVSLLFVALWKSLFLTLSSTARDALVALLRDSDKADQADAVMRGLLTELHLKWCRIGDRGAEIVAAFLECDETAKTMQLGYCNLGLLGAKFLSEGMKRNATVEILDIAFNFMGPEGAKAIITGLNQNVCITFVSLELTGIAPELITVIEYLTGTRNRILIPAAVRRVSLCLIAARRNIADSGNLAIFPKEIVKMIAIEVWATRKDPAWLNALSESERNGKLDD